MKTKPSDLGQNLQKMQTEMLETSSVIHEKDEHTAVPYYIFKDHSAEITVASPKTGQPTLDPNPDHRPESCNVSGSDGTSALQQN